MITSNEQSGAIAKIAAALSNGQLTINRLDDGSGVVLDVEREQMLTMNSTGIAIMESIQSGATTAPELAEQLTRRFEVDTQQAADDVSTFVIQTADFL